VEKITEDRMTKKVLESKVKEYTGRRKPAITWGK